MRLGEIKKVAIRPAVFTPRDATPEPTEKPAPGKSLVAVTPVADAQATPAIYRQAPFLAQLLATRDQHPQTRERRRAEPSVGIAAYRNATALVP
jgi:hypothetical protein